MASVQHLPFNPTADVVELADGSRWVSEKTRDDCEANGAVFAFDVACINHIEVTNERGDTGVVANFTNGTMLDRCRVGYLRPEDAEKFEFGKWYRFDAYECAPEGFVSHYDWPRKDRTRQSRFKAS